MKSIQDCHNWLRRVMRLRTASINVVELSFKAESMNLILFLYTKREMCSCTLLRRVYRVARPGKYVSDATCFMLAGEWMMHPARHE